VLGAERCVDIGRPVSLGDVSANQLEAIFEFHARFAVEYWQQRKLPDLGSIDLSFLWRPDKLAGYSVTGTGSMIAFIYTGPDRAGRGLVRAFILQCC
jgi:hypothetical protein